jgi:hypothetical protein
MRLSGQEYVDEYAQRGKGRRPALRPGRLKADRVSPADLDGSAGARNGAAGPDGVVSPASTQERADG